MNKPIILVDPGVNSCQIIETLMAHNIALDEVIIIKTGNLEPTEMPNAEALISRVEAIEEFERLINPLIEEIMNESDAKSKDYSYMLEPKRLKKHELKSKYHKPSKFQ